jgi:hypothetical protein
VVEAGLLKSPPPPPPPQHALPACARAASRRMLLWRGLTPPTNLTCVARRSWDRPGTMPDCFFWVFRVLVCMARLKWYA